MQMSVTSRFYLCNVKYMDTLMRTIKFCTDINTTRLPFIKVEDGIFKGASFLLDSGSTESVLFLSAYRNYKDHIQLSNYQTNILGITGNKENVRIARSQICFCNVVYDINFLLVNSQDIVVRMTKKLGFPFCGIIGNDFMVPNRWMLDLSAQEVVIRPRLILDAA